MKIFSRWVVMAGLAVALLNGCAPTASNNTGSTNVPFSLDQKWSLSWTVKGNPQKFFSNFEITNIEELDDNKYYTIDIKTDRSDYT